MAALAETTTAAGDAQDRVLAARRQLEGLFREHNAFVYRCLVRMGTSAAEAEELVQETFVVAYRKLADYREDGYARSWLFRIARNLLMRRQRSRKREDARIEASKPMFERDEILPDERLTQREGAALLGDFMRRLSPEQREVFELTHIEGLSAPEIARALELKLNTVYSRTRLARHKLEQMLERRQAIARRESGDED